MFKNAGIIFVAVLFLAGCASAPNVPQEVVEPTPAANGVSALNWSSGKASVFEANQPSELSPQNPTPIAPVKPSIPPVMTWTSLANWAAEHKVGKPHLISSTPVSSYAIGSANGVMILTIGSHSATWNGVEINLGFDPQIIDGEIYLHGLDLQKNLEPLLCEPPLTFPQGNRVIVIDPGHGGSNIGTHSVLDGRFEKEFTLDWAKRIKPLLETNGWKVFLTRDSDTYVTNANRVVFAAAHRADLFISLHFNSAAPDTKQAGLETYCFTPAGMPSTLTRGYSDPWSERLSSDDFDAQNLQLAVKMQSALLHAIGMEDRGVRHVRYIEVLRNQKCPAILIEGGYLSNPTEAKLIESADYRQKLAEAFAAALK
ncbi:MAG TPA: N-acetylmuramoyl-L-alanine amidase [Verrucomicrobiae bacterium]|nr:N-acetylmuramoyl-L-alanine amidase [Verrucomicrobiae bacterium]